MPQITQKQAEEILRCRNDPWYFLTSHVKTINEQTGEVLPFPKWGYLYQMVQRFYEGLLSKKPGGTLDMKSSQMLWTWTVAGYCLWEATFHGRFDAFISKREGDAKEIKRRSQFIYDALDDYLKPELTECNELKMIFGGVQGRLMFFPTAPSMLRTYSAFRVVWDEVPKAPFNMQKEMFASARRMCHQLNLGGTPDRPDDEFQRLWNDPAAKYVKTLIHYSQRPDRSAPDWAKKEKAALGFTDDDWERDYECNPKVSAGLVYKDFRQDIHVIQHDPLNLDGWIFGIDFGFNAPAVVLSIGFDSDGRAYVMDEFYEPGFLTSEIIPEAESMQFMWGAMGAEMWADSAEPDRIQEFVNSGANCYKANKDFELGMKEVAKRLRVQRDGKPQLFIHCRCKNTIEEFVRYAWPKATTLSDAPRRPMKKNDHAMDALRYALCQAEEAMRIRWI
jgi:hypothetical protein